VFEKLLALLIHGKTAMVAGVFVAGTSGLLVAGAIEGQPLNHTKPLSMENVASSKADKSCSTAAHLRNDALRMLNNTWEKARADLKLLDRARKADLRADKTTPEGKPAHLDQDLREGRFLDKAGSEPKGLTQERQNLDKIRHDAKSAIHAAAELGSCGDDDDKDESKATTTTSPADPALDTSTLEAKYRELLDKAVLDMRTLVEKTATGLGLSLAALQTQQENDVEDDDGNVDDDDEGDVDDDEDEDDVDDDDDNDDDDEDENDDDDEDENDDEDDDD
jgi:hypothetical protein